MYAQTWQREERRHYRGKNNSLALETITVQTQISDNNRSIGEFEKNYKNKKNRYGIRRTVKLLTNMGLPQNKLVI